MSEPTEAAYLEWAAEQRYAVVDLQRAFEDGYAAGLAEGREREVLVAAQVRLTHRSVTNPMYPSPMCNHDGETWPCLTELQVREGLYLAAYAAAHPTPPDSIDDTQRAEEAAARYARGPERRSLPQRAEPVR